MSNYSLFDIAGPIMIGPSSSHTAGAAKIGLIARSIFGRQPKKVTFYLHGSFAQVYAGHATDKALVSGILGYQTDDSRLSNSFNQAKKLGVKFEFKIKDLGENYHANTVKIVIQAPIVSDTTYISAKNNNDRTKLEEVEIIGSSIGGGMVEINQIDYLNINLLCSEARNNFLIIWYDAKSDFKASIEKYLSKVSVKIISKQIDSSNQNIGIMKIVFDKNIDIKEIEIINNISGLIKLRNIKDLPV